MAAANATRVLLGCFRTGEANDPEVYTAAMIATLADFPEHIIQAVCDPRTGLPGRSKWLPTVSEVREECDILDARDRRSGHWESLAEQTLRERREAEAAKKAAPTYDDLKAKHGPNWGLKEAGLEKWDEARRKQIEAIETANHRTLDAEFAVAGTAPRGKIPISPSLAALVRAKTAESDKAA